MIMKHRIVLFALFLAAILCAGQARAQLLVPGSNFLFPTNPTSADNITLSTGLSCGRAAFKANAYRTSMSQNNITIMLGEVRTDVAFPATCPPGAPRVEIDLGRLPAGDYTLSMIQAANGTFPPVTTISNFPFTVTDARLAKTAPFVRLDYSGHWWDPNDPGWGLFIWHDARDRVLAAWFVYGTDGKPIWYTFQPAWDTFAATFPAPLTQTSRMPGPTIPPPNPTSYTTVGSASLDFKSIANATTGAIPFDAGKLTYTFTGGPTTVRNIQRFKP